MRTAASTPAAPTATRAAAARRPLPPPLAGRVERSRTKSMNVSCRRRGTALATPDQRDVQGHGRIEAAHLDRRAVELGERARQDRRAEPARRQRAQQERVAALESEAQRLPLARSAPPPRWSPPIPAAARRSCAARAPRRRRAAGRRAPGLNATTTSSSPSRSLSISSRSSPARGRRRRRARRPRGSPACRRPAPRAGRPRCRGAPAEVRQQARHVDVAGAHERADPDAPP